MRGHRRERNPEGASDRVIGAAGRGAGADRGHLREVPHRDEQPPESSGGQEERKEDLRKTIKIHLTTLIVNIFTV